MFTLKETNNDLISQKKKKNQFTPVAAFFPAKRSTEIAKSAGNAQRNGGWGMLNFQEILNEHRRLQIVAALAVVK